MKNYKGFLLCFVLLLVLSACGSGNASSEEVINKAAQASSELKSYSLTADMTFEMSLPEGESVDPLSMSMSMEGEVVTDPMAIHQTITMDMSEFMAGMMPEGSEEAPDDMLASLESVVVETYFVEDSIYMNNSLMGGYWEMAEDLGVEEQVADMAQSPEDRLNQMKDYLDEFSVKEKENSYELTATLNGDQLKEAFKEELEKQITETAQISGDEIKFDNVKLFSVINKETYYPEKDNISFDMEITVDGDTMKASMKLDSTYADYNKTESIVVPDEIKEEAESF
ncbi:hypothetical protein J9303_15705 [Bacillaceae bacterium Marseille-Q3522]|nr:hypothetical protein [Bacillaceae bacterium Marseille-Q3522]